jgi:hypothetical protein
MNEIEQIFIAMCISFSMDAYWYSLAIYLLFVIIVLNANGETK